MGKNENIKKLTKKQKLLKTMEIPISSVSVSLSDDIKAQVEGCDSIILYDDSEVKLSAGKFIINFVGSNLQITRYDSVLTVIEGFINMVQYERGRGAV